MQRFQNILLLAGNGASASHALERAIALASSNRARLTVASVLDALPREMNLLVPAMGPANLLMLAAEERLAQLEALVEPQRGQVDIRTRVLSGRPFLEVIREVLRERHDLIMMTAEENGALGEGLFGSTSMHLMRKCPCPVWVMSPAQRHKYARVLAAIDPVTSDKVHHALNIQIMELAISLARIEDSELHIVHAWLPPTERLLTLGDRLSVEVREKLHQDWAAAREYAFREILKEFDIQDRRVHAHLIKGEPGEIIPALSRNEKIDVIVMGTVCRTGIAGLFIGNTAERILRRVNCSVLTVKPEGFVTPVKLE